ncbi:MAG: hypothetical protein V2A70_09775 [Candidatus Omnitrophota bacterium]
MFKQITMLLIFGFLFSSATVAHAEYKKVKVIGSVETKFIRTATTGQKKLALEDARKKALDKYIAELDSQRVRILNNVIDQLKQNLTTYVPEVVALDDGNWNDGYWTIGVQASINEAQIEEIVNSYIKKNTSAEQKESNLTFVFVSRKVSSVTQFDGKKTERQIVTEGNTEKVTESDTGSAGEATKMTEKVSGGSTAQKAEKVEYATCKIEDLKTKVQEVFVKAAFDVVPPSDIEINSTSFADDFVSTGNVSEDTEKGALAKAKEAGINYFAIATLDVGRSQVDTVTGMQQVYVNVKARIVKLDPTKKFNKTIASVGPKQYSATGENPEVAETNALVEAATVASKDLVDQLRLKQSGL